MKEGIHPKYVECKVTCACGNTFMTMSTKPELRLDVCSQCHPFFTGQQKFINAGGRVEKFKNKLALSNNHIEHGRGPAFSRPSDCRQRPKPWRQGEGLFSCPNVDMFKLEE